MKNKILIFDIFYVICIALQSIIKSKYPKYEVYITSDFKTLKELLNKNEYNILIIDIFNSEIINTSCFKELKKKHPKMKNILFTENKNEIILTKCMKDGIDIYLHKSSDEQKIINAIHLLIEVKKYFTKNVKIKPQQNSNSKIDKKNKQLLKLSSREIQIASLILNGKNITSISEILNISKSTVSTFKKRIFLKTNSNNIIDLDNYFNKKRITNH